MNEAPVIPWYALKISTMVRPAVLSLWSHAFELAACAFPLVIFAASLSDAPASWDTAEMQGVPYILGVAHPTGFPLYTLIGFVFSHVFIFGSIAFRLNFFSALCISAACLTAYLTAREFDVAKLPALLGATWFAITGIVWTHAIRAEAHDLALALCTTSILFWIRWQKHGIARDFFVAAGALGLAAATHPLAIWLAPGVVFACWVRTPSKALVIRGAAIIVACLALYLYLPVRSAIVMHEHLDPTVGLAGIHGGLFWNYNDTSSWSGLSAELSGSQFGAGGALLSALDNRALQAHLWSYFGVLNDSYGTFAIILAFIGVARLWALNWKITASLLVFTLATIPFSFAYASVEGDADRYRMIALWLLPILMGGAAAIRFGLGQFEAILRVAAVSAVMLIWGFETFLNNDGRFQFRSDAGGRPLINAVASHVPSGVVILTPWLDATTLAYGAYVDHSLPNRTIIGGWPGEHIADFHSWIAARPVYIIANTKPILAGVKLGADIPVDSSHTAWRVLKGPTKSAQ